MITFYLLAWLMPIVILANKPTQHMILTWKAFKCDVNPKLIDFHKCIIVHSDRSLLTAEMNFLQEIKTVNASLAIYFPRPASKDYHKIVQMSFNLCAIEKGSLVNRFVAIAYNSIRKQANGSRRCPYSKGIHWYRNVNVAENLPLFLPNSDFKTDLNLSTEDSPLLNISLSGNVVREKV